jgi:hypothetical protein
VVVHSAVDAVLIEALAGYAATNNISVVSHNTVAVVWCGVVWCGVVWCGVVWWSTVMSMPC